MSQSISPNWGYTCAVGRYFAEFWGGGAGFKKPVEMNTRLSNDDPKGIPSCKTLG
ncbi:hypothetical protein TWF594_010487 [Orbilia oligospora]|uniref:Uncharacterized protein n=1 Tax=Orbilia oligospora TaxID=2813651 RepID=A0A7C8NUJ8_ORBOL|nr:hypothetical protein TWF594_010487 [Orbilia oligospora]KAF3133175.1 hypothetical protein TWF703_007017 [Orbilia oligospora]